MATKALTVPKPQKLERFPTDAMKQLDDYANAAMAVGVISDGLQVAHFRLFLESAGIAVYDLDKVREYMKEKAEKDQAKHGWEWRPLRNKDVLDRKHSFGEAARADGERYVASLNNWSGGIRKIKARKGHDFSSARLYDHNIPLHALQKIEKIEAEMPKSGAKFFVSDYAPKPTPERPRPLPDPFLMAVIPNGRIKQDVGRFVIDFWDEPGFGLMEQLGL